MKKAFSLLELIFSIIIIGIGVAALPYVATSASNAAAQSLLSEVIAADKIVLDDIMLEPWNSALDKGFSTSSGAVMYSGILKVEDEGLLPGAISRLNTDANTTKYFHRTLALKSDGDILATDSIGGCSGGGINCADNETREIRVDSAKNTFAFQVNTQVDFIDINETVSGKTITAVFNPNSTTNTSTNAIMVSATASIDDTNSTEIIEGVSQIVLRSFAFNIGSEVR